MSSPVETPSRPVGVTEETGALIPTMTQEAQQTISAAGQPESGLVPTILAGLESVVATAVPPLQAVAATVVPAQLEGPVPAYPAALVQNQLATPTLSQQVVAVGPKKQFKLKRGTTVKPPTNSLMNSSVEGLDRLPDEDGLYPDIEDNTFLAKLLAKREFRESLQPKITGDLLKDNVCEVQEFEYTTVQRFVAQFMSPKTPYNGMLLYHGVGVGKTCTAILTAETFLELSPKNKVYILAPPAIQNGFYRTIFDINRVKLGMDDDTPNQHEGCTGNRYLELTQTYYERETKSIEFRVNKLINKRYSIMGYTAFRNMVRDILSQIPSTLSEARQKELELTLLKREFSGSLIIVDEAHNMREVSEAGDDEQDDIGVDERSDSSAGKKLAPQLRRVLRVCDGIKLLLMTATPMYNNYREIISLLNFLLHADHADESKLLNDSHIEFHMVEDESEPGRMIEKLTPESERRIIEVVNGHVSFMRGENPRAFPARLDPPNDQRILTWPAMAPNGTTEIRPTSQKTDVMRLPLVKCELVRDSLTVIQSMTESLIATKGVGIRTIDTLLQAGNCIFPGMGVEGRTGSEGFQSWFTARAIPGTFEGTRISTLLQYDMGDPNADYTWMGMGIDTLGVFSPKFNRVLQTVQTCKGISFIYSRFVENGAVIFCLLLEANGYTPWGRSAPMFKKSSVTLGGRQCSKCRHRESSHPAVDPEDNHKFAPAYYALLTATNINTIEKESVSLSPNNTAVINTARGIENSDGSKIKVIVGSQVAGEGLDLKAIREVHILEGWFHLSKAEQIVGRGIRYCSHQGLDPKQKNCMINMYVNVFPEALNKETIDQYSYRTAMNKATRVGNVSRAIKEGAADCNLNHDAIFIDGLDPVDMIDSQGNPIKVSLNDRDYTPVCDWIRCSTYTCKPEINVKGLKEDTSTYDTYAARFTEEAMLIQLKKLFRLQVWYTWDDIQKIFNNSFNNIPKSTLMGLLMKAINNSLFILENGDLQGRLIYKNNLFLFQPLSIQDTSLPLALRYGRYPVKRDSFQPEAIKVAPKKTLLLGTKAIQGAQPANATLAAVPEPNTEVPINALEFWKQLNIWIDNWAADTATAVSIQEAIPDTAENPLSKSILNYVENDYVKKTNIEMRLMKLQWWGRTVAAIPNGLRDLRLVARQFAWDSFLKGSDQIALINRQVAHHTTVANEQIITGNINAVRVLDISTKEPIYFCNKAPCPPSVLQLIKSSKTDAILTTKANQRVTAELYGFMVPWENNMMFKTNEPKPEGKDPGSGAACAIVSNVKGHRMKLIVLGEILHRYTNSHYDLTETVLTGSRKMTSAPNFCALMEIVMRWMDIRREAYGNLRYFYRPLSAYYSNHRSKK